MTATFIVLINHGTWPPPAGARLITQVVDDVRIEVRACEGGSVSASVNGDGHTMETTTVPIVLVGEGLAAWGVTWDEPKGVEVFVDGIRIPGLEDDEASAPVEITLQDLSTERESAIGHLDAREVCSEWTDWRVRTFAVQATPSTHRLRPKPLGEQVRELVGAIEDLELHLADSNGLLGRYATVAGILRALLYWNGRNYRPLLLRLAARTAEPMPLPVFALPEITPGEDSVLARADIYGRWLLSSDRQLNIQCLMDIQEALHIPVQLEQLEAESPRWGGQLVSPLSAKRLIHGVASSSGAAHYDDFARTELDWYRHLTVGGSTALAKILYDLAFVTIGLGRSVAESLNGTDV